MVMTMSGRRSKQRESWRRRGRLCFATDGRSTHTGSRAHQTYLAATRHYGQWQLTVFPLTSQQFVLSVLLNF